ncbi:MAG TPA: histidine kinase dimerization/phospho-acceptor domain-containing protein [Thermoanaerobaculia bacterium]|nr:histidine kinase dimerization/phospho-acceptor domain-containing protein [Thermoanaerobaculia bacterium]
MEPWLEHFARANFRRSSDTAHDLKTPLNVAVLNLELLRMRIRKLTGDDDEKLTNYAGAIETELRRMSRIFDAFFLLSTPPKNEGDPHEVDLASVAADVAASAGFTIQRNGDARLFAHEARIRQALKMFFEGAAKAFRADSREASVQSSERDFTVTVSGTLESADVELTKVFKFYYTDPLGNPDLSLAAARLIAETYGGELNATEDRDRVSLRLSFPLGGR